MQDKFRYTFLYHNLIWSSTEYLIIFIVRIRHISQDSVEAFQNCIVEMSPPSRKRGPPFQETWTGRTSIHVNADGGGGGAGSRGGGITRGSEIFGEWKYYDSKKESPIDIE